MRRPSSEKQKIVFGPARGAGDVVVVGGDRHDLSHRRVERPRGRADRGRRVGGDLGRVVVRMLVRDEHEIGAHRGDRGIAELEPAAGECFTDWAERIEQHGLRAFEQERRLAYQRTSITRPPRSKRRGQPRSRASSCPRAEGRPDAEKDQIRCDDAPGGCATSEKWSRRDSNPWPSGCQPDALPAELRPLEGSMLAARVGRRRRAVRRSLRPRAWARRSRGPRGGSARACRA